ncbi:MAG TPA: outer membrane beta-barrel protein [bacterium]|nr:outer membrane beta-barrel protein [bacterium]
MSRSILLAAKKFLLAVLVLGASMTAAHAETRGRQFVLNGGIGVFVGTDGLDAAFDFAIEPEYFFSEHTSLSFRFDITAGGTDSVHFGTRFRYYFNITPKVDIFVGAGAGGGVDFDGNGFGDIAIPVFGWQYGIGEHFKLGSDVSFDIIFDGDNAAFATRLLPVVLKYAF